MKSFDIKFSDESSPGYFVEATTAKTVFHQLEKASSPLDVVKKYIKIWRKELSYSEMKSELHALYWLVSESGKYKTVEQYLSLNYGFGKSTWAPEEVLSLDIGSAKVQKDDVSLRLTLDAITDYCLTQCHDYNTELKPIHHMLVTLMGDSKDEKWLQAKNKIEKRIEKLTEHHNTVIQHADEVNVEKKVDREIWN